MHQQSSPGQWSRREFIKGAGAGAAALALPGRGLRRLFEHSTGPHFDARQLARTHDLPSLPSWGPYSKKYFGISHIPDVRRGLSFDLSLFPLPSRGAVVLPSVVDRCGVHPWETAPDLDYYSLRLETLWKDQLYSELSFSRLSEHSRLIRIELVNQTGDPQELTLHCLAQLVFPPLKELTAEPIRLCAIELPAGARWVHALDYADLRFSRPRPTDNLVPDGLWRAEERCQDSVLGSVIGQNFGADPGDTVTYRLRLERSFANASLLWRYRMNAGTHVDFQMEGLDRRTIRFQGSGRFETASVTLGALKAGNYELRFSSGGGAPVWLNGFALADAEKAGDVRFVEQPWHPIPEMDVVPQANGLILKYADTNRFYGYSLGAPLAGHRLLKWRELDAALGAEAGPNTRERIFGDRRRGRTGDPDSLFVQARAQPITLAPGSRQVLHALVCEGSETEVRRGLATFDPHSPKWERRHQSARKKSFRPVTTPAGRPYAFSQRLMAATTLANLVYPLYTQRQYIRQYSPGRSWDCLYTWDAGFIGLGLLELDPQGAIEILNVYTTPPGAQSAFIHHGSPVPVQIYLFHELWNRTQSRELLEYFYPRLRQYHLFLAGRLGSSTTRRHRDHLICTWDYFYNSGGWDDYPPQKFVHARKIESQVAPTVNSSHTIRCAKLLRRAAQALGRTADLADYDADIEELSAALQRYSWDAESGYFGYVLHDEQGRPAGILRDEHGVNFNMGLDGTYPLVAGICSPDQERQILENVFSPRHLWMDIGITTVDQSAPYFSPDGYWNGSVWMAHQWFLWKTMLDLGLAERANRIAQTGLDVWKKVTDSTYDCMENFKPRDPMGRGWHQFTSLSSPVLPWFASLYTPGRLTGGFDVWIEQCRFGRSNRRLRASLSAGGRPGRQFSLLACMNPDSRYRVDWNGVPAPFTVVHEGLLQIQLPCQTGPGVLQVAPI